MRGQGLAARGPASMHTRHTRNAPFLPQPHTLSLSPSLSLSHAHGLSLPTPSLSLTLHTPPQVNYWLGGLIEVKSNDLYRMKGVLAIKDFDKRFVFQAREKAEPAAQTCWGCGAGPGTGLALAGRRGLGRGGPWAWRGQVAGQRRPTAMGERLGQRTRGCRVCMRLAG